MCSKNMNDAKSFVESDGNDRSLRRSMPRYCRRAPGRQIERGENSVRAASSFCLSLFCVPMDHACVLLDERLDVSHDYSKKEKLSEIF